ncbi:hypothetical protein TROLL_183 [Bacillus phage Troll]|uniref:Uncharacterized protein n=1 Tax=Bacillus phage Troll TaxID=1382932 RepID=S5Z7V2_9CAUD|nr:hypothetical protein TROLL_183 [Bacillus phage Troll]AGT13536.1 hypothetical protein TROLL_183 [Bacillus phage Troll]
MDLLGFLKKRLYRREEQIDIPFRGYVFLSEGNYPADVFVVTVKEKTKLFGKEQQFIEYRVFPDEGIPVPSKENGHLPTKIWSETVRAGSYKEALSRLANHVEWRRMMEGKDGWDSSITYKKVEFDKPLFGADME